MIPLIRLVVFFFTEEQVINQIKFGKNYIGRVANPEEMVIMKPNKNRERRKRNTRDDDEFDDIEEVSIYRCP